MEDIRKLLLEEKKNIELEIRSRYEESSEIDRDVGDEVDFSVVEQERELNLLLKDREKVHLEAIEEALQRIETGEYGYCEECGDTINKKRLLVIPLARYCINCQQNQERSDSSYLSSGFTQDNFSMRDD